MNANLKPIWVSPSRRMSVGAVVRANVARHATRAPAALQAVRATETRQLGNCPPCRTRQRGQAYVEYLVILLALLAVFVAGESDLADEVMKAVQDAYSRFTYALSLP
ncbi:MAG: hypothetical protein Q4D19_02510 [Lautropia sp.]|nr:hypothetical protein [Lautropia sp.]